MTEPCDFSLNFTDLQSLCGKMPKPLLVTGILVQWLRKHFGSPWNIEDPLFKDVIWSPDLASTGIIIDSVFKWNPAQTEGRPSIVIKRGPWRALNLGINNQKLPSTSGSGACCFDNIGAYNLLYQGSHTIFCIAGESAEVEILAAEVYREIAQLGPIIRPFFSFLRFQLADVGEPAILEESTENFVVPVTVSYGVQDIWTACVLSN